MNVTSKSPDIEHQEQAVPDPDAPPADETESIKTLILPVLPLRDQVLFPRVVSPLVVGRQRSLRAIERALAGDRSILVLTQRDSAEDEPGAQDLFEVGTEAIIGRQLKLPEGPHEHPGAGTAARQNPAVPPSRPAHRGGGGTH